MCLLRLLQGRRLLLHGVLLHHRRRRYELHPTASVRDGDEPPAVPTPVLDVVAPPIMYAQGVRHMQNRQQRIAVRLGVSGVSTLAWSWLRDGGTYWVVFPRHLLGEMRRQGEILGHLGLPF
jgi:hypothetical protein